MAGCQTGSFADVAMGRRAGAVSDRGPLVLGEERGPPGALNGLEIAWHLILIDHTRAFGAGTELPRRLSRIDGAFWTKIEGLTRNQLDRALGAWLDEKQIGAILDRRERMRADLKVLQR